MATKKIPVLARFGSMDDVIKTEVEKRFVDQPIESTLVNSLCRPFESSGSVVTCNPTEGYPLTAVSHIQPVQSGSGDPSPENVRPITGHTQVKLTRCGKNLSQYKSSDETNSVGHINYRGLRGISGVFLTVSADITRKDTTLTENGAMRFYIYYTDGERTTGSASYGAEKDGQPHKKVITLTADATKTIDYLRLIPVTNNVTGDRADHIQIEIGALATAYEPYRGDTFTLDLGQTVYGGYLDWGTGKLTLDSATLVFDGTESWAQNNVYTGNEGVRYDCDIPTEWMFKEVECLCSHYPYIPANQGRGIWVYPKTGKAGVRVLWSYETADQLKAYLAEQHAAGTPVQICCPLATPVTIQLTPQEIAALSGTNKLYSSTGDTDVSGREDYTRRFTELLERVAALETSTINNT